MESIISEKCQAIVKSGERCTRKAKEQNASKHFVCIQHRKAKTYISDQELWDRQKLPVPCSLNEKKNSTKDTHKNFAWTIQE